MYELSLVENRHNKYTLCNNHDNLYFNNVISCCTCHFLLRGYWVDIILYTKKAGLRNVLVQLYGMTLHDRDVVANANNNNIII